jgi:hypothetical protein
MYAYPFRHIRCTQKDNILSFEYVNPFESRGKSVEKMVRDAVAKYNIHKNFEFIVNLGDVPEGNATNIFHFCNSHSLDKTFPDFMYDQYPEANLPSYADLINEFSTYQKRPLTNKAGWIGVLRQHATRDLFFNKCENNENFECIPISWINTENGLTANNYMSYFDQADKWKYLVDIEGCGWSARLKVLLAMPRITFLIDRPFKDWCCHFIQPWKHYVPVKRDLSDLSENYLKIESDRELQQYILREKIALRNVCLTYDSALAQINNIISKI